MEEVRDSEAAYDSIPILTEPVNLMIQTSSLINDQKTTIVSVEGHDTSKQEIGENGSKPSKKKKQTATVSSQQPFSTIHNKRGRKHSNIITQGILKMRTKPKVNGRSPGKSNNLASSQNDEHENFSIFSTKIQVKKQVLSSQGEVNNYLKDESSQQQTSARLQDHSSYLASKKQNSLIDHSALFIQNSPPRKTQKSPKQQLLDKSQHQKPSKSPQSTISKQSRNIQQIILTEPKQPRNKTLDTSNLHLQMVDTENIQLSPVMNHHPDGQQKETINGRRLDNHFVINPDPVFFQQQERIMPFSSHDPVRGANHRLGTKLVKKRPTGLPINYIRNENNERDDSMVQTRTGTYADFMKASNMGSQKLNSTEIWKQNNCSPRQVNSQVAGSLFKKQAVGNYRSGGSTMTQKDKDYNAQQSSNQSVCYEKLETVETVLSSNAEMKVKIKGKNTGHDAIIANNRHSEINSVKMFKKSPLSGFDSVSVHNAKLDLLSQPNAVAAQDEYIYSQFANPFNVQSFQTQVVMPQKASSNAIVRQHIQASETASQKDNPTKVEVYKVYDLIRNQYQKPDPLRQPVLPPKTTTPKEPRMTNYQQLLKRPKTNRDDKTQGTNNNSSITKANSFRLNNEADIKSIISSDQSTKVNKRKKQKSPKEIQLYQVGEGFKNSSQAPTYDSKTTKTYSMRLNSQGGQAGGNSRQSPMMRYMNNKNTTGSKRYAGGFGGVGSIYTHSHVTQHRKHGQQRLIKNRRVSQQNLDLPLSVYDAKRVKLNSQEASIKRSPPVRTAAQSLVSSDQLMVAGNRAGMQEYFDEKIIDERQGAQAVLPAIGARTENNKTANVSPNNLTTIQPMQVITSHSPNPINNSEAIQNILGFMPQKMILSGNNLAAINQNNLSTFYEKSHSMSSNEQNIDQMLPQMQPFIMSPQSLQETLKLQQELMTAGYRLQESKKRNISTQNVPFKHAEGGFAERIVQTQHGKRSPMQVIPVDQDQALSSGQYPSMNTQQHIVAKRPHNQTDRQNISQQEQQFPSQTSLGEAQSHSRQMKPSVQFLLNDKKIDEYEEGQPPNKIDELDVKGQGNDTKDKFQQQLADDYYQQLMQDSHLTLVKKDKPSEVAIRVNKKKIEINTGKDLGSRGAGSSNQDKSSMQSREQINFSGLTNYRGNMPAAIFNGESAVVVRSQSPSKENFLSQDAASSKPASQSPSQRKFMPILKKRSYLNQDLYSNMKSPQDQHIQSRKASSLAITEQMVISQPSVKHSSNLQLAVIGVNTSQGSLKKLPHGWKQAQESQKPHEEALKNHEQALKDQEEQSRLQHTSKHQSEFDSNATPTAAPAHRDEKLRPNYTETDVVMIAAETQESQDYPSSIDEMDTKKLNSAEYNDGIFDENINKLFQANQRQRDNLSKTTGELEPSDLTYYKNMEFIDMQTQLLSLDHNTLGSDHIKTMEKKIDIMMKAIALQETQNFKKIASGQDGKELFDLSQRRTMHINLEIPLKMIKFKNKSEQKRYVRIANCILALNDSNMKKSQNDINFTYMKIFRFLADILTPEQFDCLSYYHVSRFIGYILKLTTDDGKHEALKNPVSLGKFVCQTLDLMYKHTQESGDLLARAQFNMNPSRQENYRKNSSDMHQLMTPKYSPPIAKINYLETSPESRHQQIQDKITKQAQSFANEPGLHAVIRKTYFREKETIKRGNLARLLKNNKLTNADLDVDILAKESTIARNKIVLEHIVADRNMKDWKDQVLTEIHQEQQQNQPSRSKDDSVLSNTSSKLRKAKSNHAVTMQQRRKSNNLPTPRRLY